MDVKKNYLLIFTDLADSPPKSVPLLLLFVPFIKSVLFVPAMSVDSADKPPKSVLSPDS